MTMPILNADEHWWKHFFNRNRKREEQGQVWQRDGLICRRQFGLRWSRQSHCCQSSISLRTQEDSNLSEYLAPQSKQDRRFLGIDSKVKTIWFYCSRTVRILSTTGSRWHRSKRAPVHSACGGQSHNLPTMVGLSQLFTAVCGLEWEHLTRLRLHSRELAGEHWGFARQYTK